MNRMLGVAFAMGTLLLTSGCAYNAVAGRGMTSAGVYFGTVGITGYADQITIKNGSKVNKLSFIGDGNTVTVEDQVTLPYIQFWGKDNTVSVPEYLMIRVVDVGHNNQVIRRPMAYVPPEEYVSPYVPPRTVTPAPATGAPVAPTPVKPAEKKPASPPAEEPKGAGTPETPGDMEP